LNLVAEEGLEPPTLRI